MLTELERLLNTDFNYDKSALALPADRVIEAGVYNFRLTNCQRLAQAFAFAMHGLVMDAPQEPHLFSAYLFWSFKSIIPHGVPAKDFRDSLKVVNDLTGYMLLAENINGFLDSDQRAFWSNINREVSAKEERRIVNLHVGSLVVPREERCEALLPESRRALISQYGADAILVYHTTNIRGAGQMFGAEGKKSGLTPIDTFLEYYYPVGLINPLQSR